MINDVYLAISAITAIASLNARLKVDAGWRFLVIIGILAIGVLRIAEAAVWMDDHLRHGLVVLDWYHFRRVLQVVCIVAFEVALVTASRRLPTPHRRPLTFAVCGFYTLAGTVAIRSCSLHWTDTAFRQRIGSVNLSQASQVFLLVAVLMAPLFELNSRSLRYQKDLG